MNEPNNTPTADAMAHISAELHPLAVPIDALRADPANVRAHDERNLHAIEASLRRFGQQKPIVIDAQGVVVAGNGTLEAARAMGWSYLAVVRSSLAAAERTAFAIADNRTAELAQWDEPALTRQLQALAKDETIDQLVTGFSAAEIDRLLGGEADGSIEPDLRECFQVVVECRDEAHQKAVYEKLTAEGHSCRLLTL